MPSHTHANTAMVAAAVASTPNRNDGSRGLDLFGLWCSETCSDNGNTTIKTCHSQNEASLGMRWTNSHDRPGSVFYYKIVQADDSFRLGLLLLLLLLLLLRCDIIHEIVGCDRPDVKFRSARFDRLRCE